MTAPKKPTPFSIIRHRGIQNRGQLPDGTWVYGMDKIFVEEWGGFVSVAPYDSHFIYKMPDSILGSTYVCSCGSPSIVVGLSGYVHDASPQGKLFVCMEHSNTGRHLKGGVRWV
jgi:hypothetical protein